MMQDVIKMEKEYFVREYEKGIFFQNGKFMKVLEPGKYMLGKNELDKKEEIRKLEVKESGIELVYALPNLFGILPQDVRDKMIDIKKRIDEARRDPSIDVNCVDTREQSLQILGQEIVTADKAMIRVNILARFRVTDAKKAVLETDNYQDGAYQEIQMAARDYIRARNLDDLLAGKEDMGNKIQGAVEKKLNSFGVGLSSVRLKDIILPSEVKKAMNKVVEAEREGKAKFISAREEVAAARALANAARIMSSNQNILKLKQIEALKEIAKSGANVYVTLGDDSNTMKKQRK